MKQQVGLQLRDSPRPSLFSVLSAATMRRCSGCGSLGAVRQVGHTGEAGTLGSRGAWLPGEEKTSTDKITL